MTEITNPGESGDTPVVMFSGDRRELAGIAVANILLTVVTLGLYRFWAKTRLRVFYWQHTEIDGDPLEYTGRAVELLIGFLIVVAIFIPISLGMGIVQTFLLAASPELVSLPQLFLFVVFWWLFGYAVYRARRYRLTRTLWRGIRFGQDGSPSRYAWKRFGWSLLVLLSLGIALPWYHIALRRYEMTHTRFGFSRFDYAGNGRDLFRYWWPVLLTMLVGVVAVAGLIGRAQMTETLEVGGSADGGAGFHASVPFETLLADGIGIVLLIGAFAALVGYVVLQARYRVASLRYLFAVSSLKGVAFRSYAHTGQVIRHALINFAASAAVMVAALTAPWYLVLAVLTLAALMFVFRSGEYRQYRTHCVLSAVAAWGLLYLIASAAPGFLSAVLFLLAFLAMAVFQQVLFLLPVVRHVATTLEVSDMSSLDAVVQGTRDDPRFGEGLLDALDIEFDIA